MANDPWPSDDAASGALSLGGLDLPPERAAAVAEWLRALMPEIAATSERMAALRSVPPCCVFGDPGAAAVPPAGGGRDGHA